MQRSRLDCKQADAAARVEDDLARQGGGQAHECRGA